MSVACGIDFGTSNSAVGVSDGTTPRLLPLQGEAVTVPTALFFSFEDNSRTHGREAVRRYLAREDGRLMRSIKSLLGTQLYEEATYVRHKRYEFAEIVADFLRFLRRAAGEHLGAEPDSVVLGRPAFFVDDDAEADAKAQGQLEAAARAAGFSHVEMQFEPIAAALDYEQQVSAEEIALVADIGGGTSDFSIVRVSPQLRAKIDRRDDILGYTGVHIGGTDFDRLLSLARLMPHLGLRSRLKRKGMDAPSWYFSDLATWHRINLLYDAKVISEIKTVVRDSAEPEKIERLLHVVQQRKGHDLLGRIEAAKIELSGADKTILKLMDIEDGLALVLRRPGLKSAIAEGLAKIEGRVGEVLRLAGLQAPDVSTVFLTGGSSGVPAVRDAIARPLPNARVVAGDAFASVATGLGIDARRRYGSR